MHGCHVREEPLVAMNLVNRPSLLWKTQNKCTHGDHIAHTSRSVHGLDLLKIVIRTDQMCTD